jgi:dUTP pyrophosphatase
MIKFFPTIDAPANTKLPQRSTQFSAGYDFYAPTDILVPAGGESVLIPLNIKAIMPGDMVLMLFIRSSMAVKFNLSLVNSVGIIDSDYANNQDNDGNIGVKFRNNGCENIIIREGERCAQGIFVRYYVTSDDEASAVRGGGYGSTGR